MGNVQMANSFHLNTETTAKQAKRISDQGFCLRIFTSLVCEFKMKENMPQSHIYPKASFVLGSFVVSSHSAYFCTLYRRCRISCFPVYKLVRFYVNSSKKPNTSISFTAAFSNMFMTILLFLFSVWKVVDIPFKNRPVKVYKRRNNADVYKRVRFLI